MILICVIQKANSQCLIRNVANLTNFPTKENLKLEIKRRQHFFAKNCRLNYSLGTSNG